MIKNCTICKTEFNPDHWRQKTCSKICSKELKHLNRLKEYDQVKKPKIQKTCKICSNDFETRLDFKITCSKTCSKINKRNFIRLYNKNLRKKQPKKIIIKNCITCNNNFDLIKHHGTSKINTCSDDCRKIHKNRMTKKWHEENITT